MQKPFEQCHWDCWGRHAKEWSASSVLSGVWATGAASPWVVRTSASGSSPVPHVCADCHAALLTPVPNARHAPASVRPTARSWRAPRGPEQQHSRGRACPQPAGPSQPIGLRAAWPWAAVGLQQRPAPARVPRGRRALLAQGTPGEGTGGSWARARPHHIRGDSAVTAGRGPEVLAAKACHQGERPWLRRPSAQQPLSGAGEAAPR